jgi:hypothetical protein
MPRTFLPLTAALMLLAACAGGGTIAASPAASGPSGSLGVVTAQAAAAAVSALCQMRGAADRDAANGVFYDRAHSTLHVLAAAVENVDRVSTGQVLVTMQRVEADLEADALPASFAGDASALLESVRSALAAVDLPAPRC